MSLCYGSLFRSPFLRRPIHRGVVGRTLFSDALEQRFERMMKRHDEILSEMKTTGHSSAHLGKELATLQPAVDLLRVREDLELEEVSIRELLQETKNEDQQQNVDDELVQECERELQELRQKMEQLQPQLLEAALIPIDTSTADDTERDAIVEVRAGTGGDEASLFAGELASAYMQIARALSFRVEVLSQSTTEIGGTREASFTITGGASYPAPSSSTSNDNTNILHLAPYGVFKYESGVHRVQRVPVNSSRIHTSACSVAVLPFTDDTSQSDDALPLSELKIETMRSSGAGGQHVNTTDSACRITHIPTNISVKIQKERSQHQNKALALKLITAQVRDTQRRRQEQAAGETKSGLMGGGDRSERIRTYNFPQDRVTDHRSKETRHGIDQMLKAGDENVVEAFLPQLRALYRQELLAKLDEEDQLSVGGNKR